MMTDVTRTYTQSADWRDYLEMCKPRVVLLMLLCTLVDMFLATEGMVSWEIIFFGNLGVALVVGSAAALFPSSTLASNASKSASFIRPPL